MQERKILVVEDDEATADTTRALLEHLFPQAQLFRAPDGPSGLALAAAERPHIIVLDHIMPGMDGKEFLAALRAEPWGAGVPVLAYSALNLGPVYENEHPVEFLKKPATIDDLKAALLRLVKKSRG